MAAMATLQDPFVSSALNSQLWTQFTGGSATFTFGNGCTVNYPASSTSSTDGDVTSVTTYDLTGSRAYVQVLTVPSAATHADAAFQVRTSSTNMLNFTYEAGTLFAQQDVSGSRTSLLTAPYDPVAHRWWQIRESGGTSYWEVSRDGINWVTFTSTANPITVTSLTAVLAGTCFQNETSPGTFSWRFFNTDAGTAGVLNIRTSDGLSTVGAAY